MQERFRTIGSRVTMSAILALPLIIAAPVPAQCQYEVTAIIDSPPCPFGLHSPVTATGMNNHGAVTGSYQDCLNTDRYGFYWSEKTGLITLPTPEGVIRVLPRDVNDDGVICGSMTMNGVSYLGFTYDINTHPGKYTLLPPTGGGTSSWANAINNNGIVAGARSIGPSGVNPYNAVIWDTNTGKITDLGVMNGPNSSAVDVNDAGDATGWSGQSGNPFAFVRTTTGEITFLDKADGVTLSNPGAIDSNGRVCGSLLSTRNPDSRAFIWEDQKLTVIDPLPGFQLSGAIDLNDANQILVRCTTPGDISSIYQYGELYAVNNLVVDSLGVFLARPAAINNSGQILIRGNLGSPTGDVVAALTVPIGDSLADLDFNCHVDVHDLMILLDQWTKKSQVSVGAGPSADLNGDGMVNVFDLLILLSNWG